LGCPYNTGDAALTAGALDKKACSIFGDLVQVGPARMIAQELTRHNGNNLPVYRFRFDQLPSNTTNFAKGIGTGVEQNYVFSNLLPAGPSGAWDRALAYEVSAAWASFVHGLDPNRNGSK
jgi:carboxylesterase type B